MSNKLFYGTLENAISFGPRVFRPMPISRMAGSGKRRTTQKRKQGGAGVKDKIKEYARKAKDLIVQNKLISRGLSYGADYLANNPQYQQYANLARLASKGAAMAGLGKRRRTRRRTRRTRK